MSWVLALLSGALLALSFPRYGHASVAFIAAVPLIVAASGWRGRAGVYPGTSLRRGFALGACAGVVYFFGTIYWTGAVVETFGGLPRAVALLCALALALYMTVYLAAATALLGAAVARVGVRGLWLAPGLWVAGEYARGHVLGGFPWVPLGSSMATVLPVAQLASLFGVYGLSFYLVAHTTLVAVAITGTTRQRVRATVAAVALLLAVSVWGGLRLSSSALTPRGHADHPRPHPGQHPPGREVGSGDGGDDHAALRRADPARGSRRRRRRALARVGHAVLLQRGAAAG